MGSCTQALIFANALGAKKTNKVMIPAISFAATLNSVIMGGCEPVFCDTDDAGLIDLASVDFAIAGAGVSTINYVNLWGHTVNWDKFRIHTEFFNQDLFIIEDAAQSFGASYKEIPSGKMGTVSCLSFDPTKNLNNYGSGGMLLTDDVDIYNAAVNFRDNGKMDGHHDIGTNSKMSEADCAQMLVKLRHFDAWQTRRQQIADYYASNLYSYVDCVLPKPDVTSAWSKFVIRLTHRHGLRTHLSNNGVETKIHYDKILTELPIGYEYTDYINESFREAHAFTRECLSLPIYPELTDAEVEHIVKCTLDYLR
jgi:dTDP-4-amino-4,6-dideoxygalactose transaminase